MPSILWWNKSPKWSSRIIKAKMWIPPRVTFVEHWSAWKLSRKVPKDIVEKLIEVFQMTSISDFNDIFKVLKINMKLDASAEKPDPEEIIKIAKMNYREMKEGGLWTGVNNQGSTFTARNNRTCWNCGEEGHISCECPKPKAKGKHGRGKGQNGNRKKQFNHRYPLRIRPKEGEMQKTIDGIIHHRCSECKMWCTDHDTKSHMKGLRKNQDQQGTNVAETKEDENKGNNSGNLRVSFSSTIQAGTTATTSALHCKIWLLWWCLAGRYFEPSHKHWWNKFVNCLTCLSWLH